MKAVWCVIVLLVIRFTMGMMVGEAAPQWASYDTMQKALFLYLFATFTVVAVCVMILGVADLRRVSAYHARL